MEFFPDFCCLCHHKKYVDVAQIISNSEFKKKFPHCFDQISNYLIYLSLIRWQPYHNDSKHFKV